MPYQSPAPRLTTGTPNWWEKIKERLRVLRPAWLAAVMVVALSLALRHAQAVDALHAISDTKLFSLLPRVSAFLEKTLEGGA